VDSLDDKEIGGFDVDQALDEWLDKEAASQGMDPEDPFADELEVIQRWQGDPNGDDFKWLYNRHQPLIFAAGRRYLQSTTLPKEAVKSSMLRNYVHALESYDPNRGAQFKTHLYRGMGRTGRYLQRYSNVGRIPEDRSWLIDTLVSRERALEDMLGRTPSDTELSDDVLLSAQDIAELRDRKITPKIVATLRKELRKDYLAEAPGGEAVHGADSDLRRQIVFLHGSLNPQQQVVLEHTFEGFGKNVIDDPMDLAKQLNMSPQKVRALRKQIQKKVERHWRAKMD
jgi:DNA-directed RNA polymerase specialized sigma subunit